MKNNARVALVTGGSRGIGKSICLNFAKNNIKVAINHSKPGSADNVVDEIKKQGGFAASFQADISNEREVRKMILKVLKEFHQIDFLINNAGISDQMLPLIEQDTGKWQEIINIHLKGTYLCSKEVSKYMVRKSSGKIINISSIVGIAGFPMRTAYGPAKSAIINLTKVLAIELAPFKITVNAIAPGYIKTEMVANLIESKKLNLKKICKRIPLQRIGTCEDIANLVEFLCSDKANYITGETIVVDGGWLAYGYL